MELGGYFELELPHDCTEFHENALKLNSGRNAFRYILLAKRYSKVYLPYFTCEVMLNIITELKLDFEYYSINKDFTPIIDYTCIEASGVLVYNNYFGVCDKQVQNVLKNNINIIIDNSQAFFSTPFNNIDTFYSPRKFFGVPDGAYLYTDVLLDKKIEKDVSYERCAHLLGRSDIGASESYTLFRLNSQILAKQPLKKMSNLTQRLLGGIEYDRVRTRRIENFKFYHSVLADSNQLTFSLWKDISPLVYPYLLKNGRDIKKELIKENVFIATYWDSVLKYVPNNSLEAYFVENMLCLPIDQRYDSNHLKYIVNKIGRLNRK